MAILEFVDMLYVFVLFHEICPAFLVAFVHLGVNPFLVSLNLLRRVLPDLIDVYLLILFELNIHPVVILGPHEAQNGFLVTFRLSLAVVELSNVLIRNGY